MIGSISVAVDSCDERTTCLEMRRVAVEHRQNLPPRDVVQRITKEDQVVFFRRFKAEDVGLHVGVLAGATVLFRPLLRLLDRDLGDVDAHV